jgi:hypothetical protein
MNEIIKNQARLVAEIKHLIRSSQAQAIRKVDFQRVLMYHGIGGKIFTEEQNGKTRADYGKYLIKTISSELEPEFGNGFSIRILEIARQFYRTFPIANALRSQLNWAQYKLLTRIDDNDKREFYINEAILASKYQLYLPTEQELIKELKRELWALEDLNE